MKPKTPPSNKPALPYLCRLSYLALICPALPVSSWQVAPHPNLSISPPNRTSYSSTRTLLPRPLPHQLFQAQILPRALLLRLGGALDAKRGVLVGDDVVFVFRVGRLVLWRDVDLFVG